MLNSMVLKFFYPIKLTRVMAVFIKVNMIGNYPEGLRSRAIIQVLGLTGIKHQEMPYNLCQFV